MSIKNLHDKLEEITAIPRIGRTKISKILEECYKQGKQDEKKLIKYVKSRKRYKKLAKNNSSVV